MANQAFLTGVFKLHNPSLRKRTILDHVFREYTQAVGYLLDWSKTNLDSIRESGKYRLINQKTGEVKKESYTAKSIASVLPRPSALECDLASALKEALVANVAMMLASYLELENHPSQVAEFPTGRNPDPFWYFNATEAFCRVFLFNMPDTSKEEGEQQENKARDMMLTARRGNYMPIHFSRSRDVAILTDQKRKNFIWLKLLGADSPLAQSTIVDSGLLTVSKYEKIQAGQEFKTTSKIGLLLPIELGQRRWQYRQFLEPCLKGEAVIKSAKLVRDNGDYYLHVSFAFETPPLHKPLSYLGIDRGVLYSMSYAVIDLDGRIQVMDANPDGLRATRIETSIKVQEAQRKGRRIGLRDYRQKEIDNLIHIIINQILNVATRYQSAIVIEDLNLQVRGKLYKSAFKKMERILGYKAKFKGVPVLTTWAAYTSQICIYCGERNQDRKRDGSPFTCPNCMAEYHSDAGAAVNIARRALYRSKDWGGDEEKPGDYFAFHRSFANVADF